MVLFVVMTIIVLREEWRSWDLSESDDDYSARDLVDLRSGLTHGMVREDHKFFGNDSNIESSTGKSAGRGFGGNRGCRGMLGENYEESLEDDSSLASSLLFIRGSSGPAWTRASVLSWNCFLIPG